MARKIALSAYLIWVACFVLTVIVVMLLLRAIWLSPPLLIAPMMNLTSCMLAQRGATVQIRDSWLERCYGEHATSTHLIESTLEPLQPLSRAGSRWQLGYTLQVPLLSLLQADASGWTVNQSAIDNIVHTVRDNERPLVLYLFSTHFSVNAPIESELMKDPDNVAQTPKGSMAVDNYYGQPLYPWSIARTDNAITQYRVKVMQSVLSGLCTLSRKERSRIKAITLLGEVHHLFPDFSSGMGFDHSYLVSDYSGASIHAFRNYLEEKYHNLQSFNREMGSDYKAFGDVVPPNKDIRKDTLKRYQEHVDSFASGLIPMTGWVHTSEIDSDQQTVKIYMNGRHIADAPVNLSRQDVRAAHPEFKSADLGWRFDLDYTQLPTGIHRIDFALDRPGKPLALLATRSISIMDRQQRTPVAVPSVLLPVIQPLPAEIANYTDEPREQRSYYYNPLAREWQAFREVQVVRYLEYFNQLVTQSCLGNTPRYTHQIVPHFNPGWDSGKYAVTASLQPTKSLHTGISLYGEASYGRSLRVWFKQIPHHEYGVTEFHPLQTMGSQQLESVLGTHRSNGARFLSFFLETRWHGQPIPNLSNLFSFDPDNHQYDSDELYTSMQVLLMK